MASKFKTNIITTAVSKLRQWYANCWQHSTNPWNVKDDLLPVWVGSVCTWAEKLEQNLPRKQTALKCHRHHRHQRQQGNLTKPSVVLRMPFLARSTRSSHSHKVTETWATSLDHNMHTIINSVRTSCVYHGLLETQRAATFLFFYIFKSMGFKDIKYDIPVYQMKNTQIHKYKVL